VSRNILSPPPRAAAIAGIVFSVLLIARASDDMT
jgi:hypothetical protein